MFWKKRNEAPAPKEPLAEREASAGPQIKVSLKPEDRPKFCRVYEANLTEDVKVTVSMKSYFSWSRSTSGELEQTGRRYVWFDPERVADRILDPNLVPLVEGFCQRVFRMDKEFLAQRPSEFTDESGAVWKRD